ncbi:hypothetical protein Tco_1323703, partial [Tanacetum coccineum]
MARIQANPYLSSTLLRVDATDDTFATKMVALVKNRRNELFVQWIKELRERTITPAQQRLENSPLHSFKNSLIRFSELLHSHEDVPEEEVEDSTPSKNATDEEDHTQGISTKDIQVHSTGTTEVPKDESSIKRVGTKRKLLGRKGVHVYTSSIPIEEGDPDAEHKLCIK